MAGLLLHVGSGNDEQGGAAGRGRGYAFTGDWQPDRIPDMHGFVEAAHKIGVKVLLWYSVPYIGKNSKVAERFRDKLQRCDSMLDALLERLRCRGHGKAWTSSFRISEPEHRN